MGLSGLAYVWDFWEDAAIMRVLNSSSDCFSHFRRCHIVSFFKYQREVGMFFNTYSVGDFLRTQCRVVFQ
jgi:hypothetical protein